MEQTLVDTAILHPAYDSIKNEDHQIECKDLIINILPEPEEPPRWPDCCIYRVPKRLREVRKRAYTPRLVSIGPFHYSKRKDQTFKDMEKQKVRYFWYFCKRTGKSNKDELAHIKDEFAHIIQNNEEKIRHCYSEDFGLGRKEFVEMILLDAVFILELFCRKYEKHSGSSKAHDQIDYILSRPCMERGILHDLLLLENQLPFFVLEKLYIFLLENYQIWDLMGKKPTLIELSCRFFDHLIYDGWRPKSKKCGHVNQCFTCLVGYCRHLKQDPKLDLIAGLVEYFDPNQQNRSSPKPKKEVMHLTDLVRYFFCRPKTEKSKPKCCTVTCTCTGCSLPPNQEQEDENKRIKHLQGTATKLDEAGLKVTTPDSECEPKHCMFIDCFCPNQEQEDQKYVHLYCTATKLDEAGLKFTTPDSETVPLIQIQLREKNRKCLEIFPCFNLSWLLSCLPSLKSTCLVDMQRFLEVPPLLVDDKTEGLFRNLMALEQCHYPSETHICDYMVLLDNLITTEADVRLLVDNKIIVNYLGSNHAVMELFNKLGLEIELGREKYHYHKLCKDLNGYSEKIWNRLVGTLTSVYFTDFFKGTATVVGIIVLVLTLWNFSRVLSKI